MVSITYSSLTQEWVVKYHLEDICTQTVKVADHWAFLKEVEKFCAMEKGVANGKTFQCIDARS